MFEANSDVVRCMMKSIKDVYDKIIKCVDSLRYAEAPKMLFSNCTSNFSTFQSTLEK